MSPAGRRCRRRSSRRTTAGTPGRARRSPTTSDGLPLVARGSSRRGEARRRRAACRRPRSRVGEVEGDRRRARADPGRRPQASPETSVASAPPAAIAGADGDAARPDARREREQRAPRARPRATSVTGDRVMLEPRRRDGVVHERRNEDGERRSTARPPPAPSLRRLSAPRPRRAAGRRRDPDARRTRT